MKQDNLIRQFGRSEQYFHSLQAKHAGTDIKISRYKKDFLAKFKSVCQTDFPEELQDALQIITGDLDLILLEITEDFKFMQLGEIGTALISLFDVFVTIQSSLLRKTRNLADVAKAYKKREEYQKMGRALCHVCSRNIEQAKLKSILPITTYATHEMRNKQSQSFLIEQQIKRLDLQNFYGNDRNQLMRKITQLLNQKSISLNRKPAQTQQTLNSILQQMFEKSPEQPQIEQQIQQTQNGDIVDTITNTVKQQLLRNAGAPLKNYIQTLSQYKLKQLLIMRQKEKTSVMVQTSDFKSIEHIRILENRVKSLNHQLVSRKMRTQEVERELIQEIIEGDKCKKRILDLEKAMVDLKEVIKGLESNKLQHQSNLQKVHQEKLQQISKIQSQYLETINFLKKEISHYMAIVQGLSVKLEEKIPEKPTFEDMGVQTVFVKQNEETQTSTVLENTWLKSSMKSTKMEGTQKTSKSLMPKRAVRVMENLKTAQEESGSEQSRTNRKSKLNKSVISNKTKNDSIYKKPPKRKRVAIMNANKNITTAKNIPLNPRAAETKQKSQQKIAILKQLVSIKNLEQNDDPLSEADSNQANIGTQKDEADEFSKPFNQKEIEFFKAIIDRNIPDELKEPLKNTQKKAETQRNQVDQISISMEKMVLKKLGKDLLKSRTSRRPGKFSLLRKENLYTQPPQTQELRQEHFRKMVSRRNINDQVDALKAVLVKEFDFLEKIGIITLLERLKLREAPKTQSNYNPKLKKQSSIANAQVLRPPKLDYPLNAQLPVKLCNSDFDLFGGYKGAMKFIKNKGIYSNDIISFDNHSQIANLISKTIESFPDDKTKTLLKNFLVNPIGTAMDGIIEQDVKCDAVKAGIKKIFKFHSHCKPKCNHIWSFFSKFGISESVIQSHHS